MRYLVATLLLVALTVLVVAGRRGDVSRRAPIEIFDDMVRQDKLRPQQPNSFFGSGISSQPHVAGTVAQRRGTADHTAWRDTPVNTGLVRGTTNFVATIPVPVTEHLMARGRERFAISCLPCHGAVGDGNGITKRFGMAVVANLHDARIAAQPDGEIYYVISKGRNLMEGYADKIEINDRWAIVAYVRALQRAKLASLAEVPAEARALLK